MKIISKTIILAVCSIFQVCYSRGLNIQGETLIGWPKDFSGVAIIPSAVRHIGSEAFSGCRELTAVVFPEFLETIGSFAFSECNSLKAVEIPATVTKIGRSAFFNCQALTNVVILAKIKKIPDNTCSHCYGLRHIELPDTLVEIGDMAFRGCRSLQNINIPSSVKRVGRGAFVGCSRLSGVELPRMMENIDNFAFYCCYDLKCLVIHSVPLQIGVGAFRDCHNLREYVLTDPPKVTALYSVPSNCEITVENICKGEWLVGSYGTVEDALLAADKKNKTKSDMGMLDGLERALRIAADGMVGEMPDAYYPVGKIDSLAANLFKLSAQDGVQKIKDYFKSYSSSSVDSGNTLVANLSMPGDIAITVEFHDEKLIKLTLSDGLKKLILKRLMQGNVLADSNVLKWLK